MLYLKRYALVIATTFACACGSIEPVSEEVSGLMPDAVATRIIAEFLPYSGGPDIVLSGILGTIRVPIRSEIGVHYNSNGVMSFYHPRYSFPRVCGVVQEDARNLARALLSKGATVTLMMYPEVSIMGCDRTKKVSN